MTQRSILAGTNPTVVIKAGANVTVIGIDGNMVTANTNDRWGLKIEQKSEAEFARARAAVGETVLFDLRFNKPGARNASVEIIEIQMGGSGEVLVPFGSNVKIYAGRNIDVTAIRGQVDAVSGFKLNMEGVFRLGNASAGRSINLDCETMAGDNVEIKAGSDIRFHVRDLTNALIRVKDLGGYWEAKIGAGQKSVYLKSGGDVTLVTDQPVEALPPNFILGKIEKPPDPA